MSYWQPSNAWPLLMAAVSTNRIIDPSVVAEMTCSDPSSGHSSVPSAASPSGATLAKVSTKAHDPCCESGHPPPLATESRHACPTNETPAISPKEVRASCAADAAVVTSRFVADRTELLRRPGPPGPGRRRALVALTDECYPTFPCRSQNFPRSHQQADRESTAAFHQTGSGSALQ
mgnify:CR=1 FL=1